MKFYVTYGYASNLGNNFSVVEAEDYSAARKIIHEAIGSKFAFCYPESDWILKGGITQEQRYNLTQIPLQAQVIYE